MRQTVVYCDLHDGAAEATGSVQVLVEAGRHRLDVCADHASWLRSLPVHDDAAGEEAPASAARPLRPIVSLDRPAPRPATNGSRPAAGSVERGSRTADHGIAGAGRAATPGVRAGSRRSLRAERAAARDWARTQGREVADRGRLPAGLLERYREEAG